jgi:hypothetical protein
MLSRRIIDAPFSFPDRIDVIRSAESAHLADKFVSICLLFFMLTASALAFKIHRDLIDEQADLTMGMFSSHLLKQVFPF